MSAALDELAPQSIKADFQKIGFERRADHAKPTVALLTILKSEDARYARAVLHVAGEHHVRVGDCTVLMRAASVIELMHPVEAAALAAEGATADLSRRIHEGIDQLQTLKEMPNAAGH